MKFLLLLVLMVVGLVWWKTSGKKALREAQEQRDRNLRQSGTVVDAETMVTCAQCGVHLPASQSLPGRGGVFCSSEHRQDFEQSAHG